MIEKYEVQARSRRRKASVVKKRRSTKRRSTKRRSTKRRSPKRRSRFGANETLIEGINNIAEEDEEEDVPPIRTRDSTERKRIENTIIKVQTAEAALAEAVEARAKAEAALAKANEARANEAPPPLPPLPPIRRVSKWRTPGDRGPAPPPTARFNKEVPVGGSSLSEARAAAGAEWVDEAVNNLVNEIEKIGYKDKEGRKAVKFIDLFNHYVDVSDSLVGIMIRAKKRGRIEYVGEMLLQGQNDNVVITVI